MDFIFRMAEKFMIKHKRLMRYRRVFAAMAAVVVFATTYELILPAITMDSRRAAQTPGVEVGVAAEDTDETAEDTGLEEAGTDSGETRESGEDPDETEQEGPEDAAAEEAVSAGQENSEGTIAEQADLNGSAADPASAAEEDGDDGGVSGSAPVKADASAPEETENAGEPEGRSGQDGTEAGQADGSADGSPKAAGAPDSTGAASDAAGDPETSSPAEADPAAAQPVAISFEGKDYIITATFDEKAALPADVRLDVTEILPDMVYKNEEDIPVYADYEEYYDRTVEALEKEKRLDDLTISSARFFDISFSDADGRAAEPAAPVSIAVRYADALSAVDTTGTVAVHFDDVKIEDRDEEEVPEIGKAAVIETQEQVKKKEIEEISFEAEKFSVYAIVSTSPGTPISMTKGSTETIEPQYESGVTSAKYQEYTWATSDSGVVSITSAASGDTASTATVRANKSGTATLTLTYAYGKNKNNKTTRQAVFTVTVTEPEADPEPAVSLVESSTTVQAGGTVSIAIESSNGNLTAASDQEDTATVVIDTSDDGKAVVITGVAEGTATITVTASSDGKTATAEIAVTVTAGGEVTEEEATAQTENDSTLSGMTVTVKETGRLKKLSGYHVVAEDAAAEYADQENAEGGKNNENNETDGNNVLKAYHIYLADEEGREVTGEELAANVNGTINLKVTLAYDEEQDWFNQAKDIKHYKSSSDRAEQFINNIKFGEDKKTISFKVHGFSDFVITSDTHTTSGGTPVTTQQGSILNTGDVTYNDANEWQIVSGGYSNNNAGNKTAYGNDSYQGVRVQKNIIPTGIENEFLVYLSVDTKLLMREYLQYASYQATTSNNYHSSNLGDIVDAMTGNEKVQVSGEVHSGWNHAQFTIQDHNGNVIVSNTTLYWSQANNVTFYLKVGSGSNAKYVLMGLTVSKNGTNTVRLSKAAETLIYEDVMKAIALNQVTDTMGDYIDFVEVVKGDYDVTPVCSGGILTWNPKMKESPKTDTSGSGSNIVTWNLNAAELLYKARLKVDQTRFKSCANNMQSVVTDSESYPVNTGASISYNVSIGGTTQTNKTATFPIPYVRGLLYDVTGQKIDSETREPIAHASLEFALSGTGVDGTAVSKTATMTDSNGNFTITGVQAAQSSYALAETQAPAGYVKKTDPKAVALNYTNTNPSNRGSVFQAVSGTGHMKLANDNSTFIFENEFTVVNLKLTKKGTDTDAGTQPLLSGASFKLEKLKLKDDESGEYEADTSWGSMTGTTDGSGILRWDSSTTNPISPGTYQITETAAPSGYVLNSNPVIITINDNKTITKSGGTGAAAYTIENATVTEGTGDSAKEYVAITAEDDPIRIAVKKVGASGTSGNYTPIGGVDFTLTGMDTGTGSGTVDTTATRTGTTDVNAGTDQGYIFWEKIPAGTYTLAEGSPPDGYKPSLSAAVVVNPDGMIESVTPIADATKPNATSEISSSGTLEKDLGNGKKAVYQVIQVINRKSEISVIIRKTDNNGDLTGAGATTQTNYLAGAKFTVYDEANQPIADMNSLLNAESDAQGYVTKTTINQGTGEVTEASTLPMEIGKTYYLEETEAPDGYNLPEGKYKLVVGEAGISLYNYNKGVAGGYNDTPFKNFSVADGGCTVLIQNNPGVALPITGGTGFLSPQTFFGIIATAFVLAAGVMYSFSVRREERRYQ